jgi:hypothetical protein
MRRILVALAASLLLLAIASLFSGDGIRAQLTQAAKPGKQTIGSGPCPAAWTVIDSPNLGSENNYLSAVEAVSDSDIWAVGQAGEFDSTEIIQHWNGLDWSMTSGPQILSDTVQIADLTSLSSNDLWAVGYHYPDFNSAQTLVEHWDGYGWQTIPSHDLSTYGNYLNAVDAVETNDVWAVGGYFTTFLEGRVLVQHWDGIEWNIVPTPNFTATGSVNILYGVDAVSANDIWAVGRYKAGSGMPQRTLIQHWDGTEWHIVSSPNLSDSPHNLRSVSAISANDVWAVGNHVYQGNYRTLIEHWDGTQWNIVPSPNAVLNNSNQLRSVSAISPTNVWAAGYYFDGYSYKTLTLHWDGSAWSIVNSPNPGQADYLYAVAALPDGKAVAVGSTDAGSNDRTLIVRYAPSCASVTPTPTPPLPTPTVCAQGFNIVPSPNGLYPVDFLAVTAISATDAWGVGAYHLGNNIGQYSLIKHWDGTQWTIISSDDREPGRNNLKDIDAGSADDIWAVGDYNIANTTETLTKHWDGAQWINIASPNPGIVVSSLEGVSVLSTGEAWAVGNVRDGSFGSNERTLILHWEDKQWAVVPSPNPGSASNRLTSIKAISPTNAWAVGYQFNADDEKEALVLHWGGAVWSVVPLPSSQPYVGSSYLEDISATSEDNIWAVGSYYDNRYDDYAPLMLHWDGIEWSILASGIEGAEGQITDVHTTSTNDAWAITSTFRRDAVLHWDGTTWGTFQVATPHYPNYSLKDISAASAQDVWVAGQGNTDAEAALLEHYDGVCRCPNQFADIAPDSTFYSFLRCLSCREILGGYPCGGPGEPCDPGQNPYFRPNNPVTRGQLSKIVALARGNNYGIGPEDQTFEDVPPGSTFWLWIEQISRSYVIDGYPCGGSGEPCIAPANRPYFRPGALATRGQIAKVIAKAAGYYDPIPEDRQTFEDVLPGSTFWLYVEELANHAIIEGYLCSGPGEPCVPPLNRRYFRPGVSVTRAQIAKISSNTFFPNCITLEP